MLNELLIKDLSEQVGINTSDIQNIKDGEIYSTSEIKTNKKWIDGKPIYRKTIDCGKLLGSDTVKSVAHNISNIDLITDRKAFGYISTGNKMTFDIPFGGNTSAMFNGAFASARADNTFVYLVVHGDLTTYSAYMTLEYTKTTD